MMKMTDKQLKESKELLDFFGVKYDEEVIYLTSGGKSLILNSKTRWKKFSGYSLNEIIESVAKRLGKKTQWLY
jgi:hypothetical protein